MRIPLDIPLQTGKAAACILTITAVHLLGPTAKFSKPCSLRQYEAGPAFIENKEGAQIAFQFSLVPENPTAQNPTTPAVLVYLSYNELNNTKKPQDLQEATGKPAQFTLQAATTAETKKTETFTLSPFDSNRREITITVYETYGERQELTQIVVRIVPEVITAEKWLKDAEAQLLIIRRKFAGVPNLTPEQQASALLQLREFQTQYDSLTRLLSPQGPDVEPTTSAGIMLFQSLEPAGPTDRPQGQGTAFGKGKK